jgi:hypothetical protein
MAFTAQEEELYLWLKTALPSWLFGNASAVEEHWGAMIEQYGSVRVYVEEIIANTFVMVAIGPWLDQHAKDRGIFRQENESDDSLRERIRNVETKLTREALAERADGILTANSMTTGATIVNLRSERAWFVFDTTTGRQLSYLSTVNSGFTDRMSKSGKPSGFVIMLPYGTSAAVAASIQEAVRQNKAAGFWFAVEVRGVP